MNNKRKIYQQISSGFEITKKVNTSKEVDEFSNMPSTSGIESIVLKPPQKATSSRPIMKSNVPVGPTEKIH